MVRTLPVDDRAESTVFAPIDRPRLVERLSVSARFPIALLIAPAGYGKSIALRQYLGSLREPFIRFALRAEHATLLSFLRGFAEALGESAPHAITALAGAYERNQASSKRGTDLARWMDAHLESFSGVIAIDDLHIADDDAEVARFLTSLIERSKDRIRWILASRSTTGLPIGSWLAYREADLAIDENDLRFTFEEAAAAARDLGLSIRDNELRDLLDLTEGWPAAMSFALRTSTRSSDLRNVSAVTREMIYRFLAEQVYGTLDEEERSLLEVAMALPTIVVEVLERAGFDRALQIVERLRERTAFIHEESPGVYHCHDLFKEFLRHQNALAGKRSQQLVQERAAGALEESGDVEHAVAAYAAAGSREDVLRLLEQRGFDMVERARSDVVSRAIAALDENTRRENPAVLALHGTLQAMAGKFTRAESLLRRSLARAGKNRDLAAKTSLRLAAMLGNQGADVAAILDPVANDSAYEAGVRAEALSLLAAQRSIAGNIETASVSVENIERLLPRIESDVTRAKVLHYLGIINKHIGATGRAVEALRQSSALAAELHLFSLASRANAVLSNLALHEEDDAEQQLRYAELAAGAAVRAGDAFALGTALLQILSAATRGGDVEKVVAVEGRLVAAALDTSTRRYVTFFRSVRLAWQGRFCEAHRLMSTCWDQLYLDFDRISAGAQYALFLALDGCREASVEMTESILRRARSLNITSLFRARSIAISRGYCAVAEAANGRVTQALRILRNVDSGDVVEAAVSDSIRAMLSEVRSGSSGDVFRVRRSMETLRSSGYMDSVRLLQAAHHELTRRNASAPDPHRLTPSELAVLRLLASGLAPKEIAEETTRSVNTVRVHIANVIGKLECHGQSQAIAAARRLGIL